MASLSFHCDLRKGASVRNRAASSLTGRQEENCGKLPRQWLQSAASPHMRNSLSSWQELSWEKWLAGMADGASLLSPSQTWTCRRWGKAVSRVLLAAPVCSWCTWGSGVGRLGTPLYSHIPAMAVKEANTAQPKELTRKAPCHHFLSWCGAVSQTGVCVCRGAPRERL